MKTKFLHFFCSFMIIASYCYGQRKFNEMPYKQQKISNNVITAFIITTNGAIMLNSYNNNKFDKKMERNMFIFMGSFLAYTLVGTFPKESKIQLSKENIGLTYTF